MSLIQLAYFFVSPSRGSRIGQFNVDQFIGSRFQILLQAKDFGAGKFFVEPFARIQLRISSSAKDATFPFLRRAVNSGIVNDNDAAIAGQFRVQLHAVGALLDGLRK